MTKATGKARHPHNKNRPEPKAVRVAIDKADKEALKIALTPRQRRFSEEYVIDFNGSAAAVRAGYSPLYADRQASTLLHHAGVSAYIDHLTRSKEAKVMSLSPDYLLQKINDIISSESAKDSDKLRGIELCMKHLGMFIERQEITGKDGGAIEVEERRIQQDVDSLVSTIKRMGQKDVTVN